jgi:hypothetical protein
VRLGSTHAVIFPTRLPSTTYAAAFFLSGSPPTRSHWINRRLPCMGRPMFQLVRPRMGLRVIPSGGPTVRAQIWNLV